MYRQIGYDQHWGAPIFGDDYETGFSTPFVSVKGDPSEFGWEQTASGGYSRGNQYMSAGEMASQLPRWKSIKNNSDASTYDSGQNYLKTIQDALGQGNAYEDQLKSLLANPDSIKDTGAYKFAFDQGQQSVERSAAAKGMLGSGNVLAELTQFGQGLASQQYDKEANRLAGLSGTQKNYLLGTGQLALSGAKAKSDDYFNARQLANQFSLNSGYGKQSLW